MAASVVEVWRGEAVESRHRVTVAVCDGSGRLRACAGSAAQVTYARSAIKPLQVLPLIEDGAADAFGITAAELAVCCASHSGEARHVEAVASILRKIGADEDALACGPHAPYDAASAELLRAKGEPPNRLHNNCSGKHAGMLALARHRKWPLAGYHLLQHPVQQRMLKELVRWTGRKAEEVATAIDGCGVVTFALTVGDLACAAGRFAAAARRPGTSPARVHDAMARNPELVGGSNRLCTELMRVVGGRVFVKVGAEGVYLAGAPGAELGLALKVEDGAGRAAEPALIAVLRALHLLSDEETAALEEFAEPRIRNTRGEIVGCIRAVAALEGAVG